MNSIKICKKCGRKKEYNDFAKNGKNTRTYCKECESSRAKENYQKTQTYIRQLKTKCQICGYDKNPSVLEYHHSDNNKENVLAKLCSRHLSSIQKNRIDEEIKKCQLLCANCHRELHFKNLNRY